MNINFQTFSTVLHPAFWAAIWVVVRNLAAAVPLCDVFTAHGVGLSLQVIILLTLLPKLPLLPVPLNLCRSLNFPA